MREVLSHRVQVLLGPILGLSRVDIKLGRSFHGIIVSLEVLDLSKMEIVANCMIGDEFLIGGQFSLSQHRVFNSIVEVVSSSLVPL